MNGPVGGAGGEARAAALRAFVRDTYGPRGTLRLHRAAFGLDLLRAPLNVLLAPVFLLVRLLGLLAGLARLRRLAAWLGGRRILLETAVARAVARRVTSFIAGRGGKLAGLAPEAVAAGVADYVGVRSAVAEITTVLLVLAGGYALFHTPFLGVLSLAGPVAEMRAQALAIESFWAGPGLGRMWYGMFPARLAPWQVGLTGAGLAMLASLVTTFAGILADPLQVLTGSHRRRLERLLARLEAGRGGGGGLAREHLAARLGDLSDLALTLWRALR